MIWCFIKFFTKEEHADQFLAGKLYLNRLSTFKLAEAKADEISDGRPDEHEAVAAWWQPHDVIIKMHVPQLPHLGEIEITAKDLAAPVSMAFSYHQYMHVLCMYAVQTPGFKNISGAVEIQTTEIAELQQKLKIDERCFKLGDFAVIVPTVQFLEHIKPTLQNTGYWYEGRLVEYYDETVFHGEHSEKDIPFKKQKGLSYQNEFRICVWSKTQGDDALTLDVGDISHFCAKVRSSLLPGSFMVNVSPADKHTE
jgi:virulence-associated protein VapD